MTEVYQQATVTNADLRKRIQQAASATRSQGCAVQCEGSGT